MNSTLDWLNARGTARQQAVEEAASHLLREYRERWSRLMPVELHRLASTLRAKIEVVRDLAGGARLIPVPGGFHVLVCHSLGARRFRTAVAHEFAHTLFYTTGSEIPRRLADPTKTEEVFCFDVARRVLAPPWLLDDLDVRAMDDVEQVFRALTERLKLSRPLAARVLLEDYRLVRGLAGRWSSREGVWKSNRGEIYASPSLGDADRRELRAQVELYLTNRPEACCPFRVFAIRESDGRSAFVLIEARAGEKR